MRKFLAQIRLEWLIFCFFSFHDDDLCYMGQIPVWCKVSHHKALQTWRKSLDCGTNQGHVRDVQAHITTRMVALLGALNYSLMTDCWVMLLPANWRISVRICICCKVAFERGVSSSTLGSCQMLPILEWVISHTKMKYSPFSSLKPAQDRICALFFRETQNDLEAQAAGSDSVCDVTCVRWMWDQAKTPPEASGQRVEDMAQSQPSLLGRFCPSHPVPWCCSLNCHIFRRVQKDLIKFAKEIVILRVFPFFFFSSASVVLVWSKRWISIHFLLRHPLNNHDLQRN